jgi:acyl carrier protein
MVQNLSYLADLVEIFQFELDEPKMTLSATDSRETIANWDSLAHVRIVAAIERKFNIQFDLDEIEEANDVQKLSAVISKHLSKS